MRDVQLDVAEGEIVGLIGPNGSGKTTLFNLITGFFDLDGGTIHLDELDVSALPAAQRCKLGIARTFQLVRPFQNLSALDNVAVGRIYGRDPARSRAQAAHEALDLLHTVGLADHASDRATSLTLQNRKRLELARALATHPRLLLLDELLAGLNPSEVLSAVALIRQIRERGVTIIMVEHLVKAVFGISDRVVVLSAGEKIADETPSAVSVDPVVIDAYLGAAHHA